MAFRFNQDKICDDLLSFLRFPSISADGAYRNQTLACATYLKETCERMGFDKVSLLDSQGFPAVFAQLGRDPEKETVLFYGHYDVQPVDPLDLWDTAPFEPTIRDGYLYARGVADDKGQVFCHLKAISFLISQSCELPFNVKFLIEGEEEIGSPHLADLLSRYQSLLKAQVILISDTPMFSRSQPSLCTSLRGLVHSEIWATCLSGDLHSGQHGGAVQNPIHALGLILSSLKGTDGRVLIPGFYDDVLPIDDIQKEALSKLSFSDSDYLLSLGTDYGVGEVGFSTLERRWYRPTLDCNGIIGGYTGEGSKTVLPAKASMKISMRLVANQDPDLIKSAFDAFLEANCPKGVQLTVETHAAGAAYACSMGSPYLLAAQDAVTHGFGKRPLFVGEGGSIPIVPLMADLFKADVILMGFNLPDDAIHAPNERFLLDHYFKGIQSAIYFYQTGLVKR